MLTPEQRGQRDAEPVELIPPVNRRPHEEAKHEHRESKPGVTSTDKDVVPHPDRTEKPELPFWSRLTRGAASEKTEGIPSNRTEQFPVEEPGPRPDYVRSWD